MSAKNPKNQHFYDKRVMARHVAAGRLSKDNVQKYLNGLVDMQDQCEDIADQIFSSNKKDKTK